MSALDWAVLAGYLLLIASVGTWLGRDQKDNDDFLLGGRSIPWWAALLSLVATEISAATFLGAPEQGYIRDLTYLQFAIGTIAARFVLAYAFISVFYKAGVTTVYEFLGRRFGGGTQRTTAGLFLFGRLFADGSRLFIAAITLEVVTGWRIETSILVLALVTVAYTSAGGIKAVIWTDVMQAVVLVGAGFVMLGYLFSDVGLSAGQVWTQLDEANKLNLFGSNSNWLSDPYAAVTAIVGGFFLTLATHGTDHDMVQRLLTCKDDSGSRRSMWLSGFIGVGVTVLFLSVGLLLYLFTVQLSPEAELAKKAAELGQAGQNGHYLLYYALARLSPGLVGLIVAGILAAAMSSLSSALNAMTATFVGDFYRHYWPEAAPENELKVSRVCNLTIGFLISGLALMICGYYRSQPNADLLSLALGVMTLFYGGLLGIFLVALFTRTRGNDLTNLAAAVLSTCVVFGLRAYTNVAWPWFIVVGTVVAVAISALGRSADSVLYSSQNEPESDL